MTNEEKQLLLIDLCARLPYGVKININSCIEEQNQMQLFDVNLDFETIGVRNEKWAFRAIGIINDEDETKVIKPYLRPMSSMTEEELKAYRTLCKKVVEGRYISDGKTQYGENLYRCYDKSTKYYDTSKSIDFLNEFHFDHHGLIKKFLALPAPKDMYKIK